MHVRSWSVFLQPMYERHFGVLGGCKVGLLSSIPISLGLALPSLLPVGTLAAQLILTVVMWFRNIMAVNVFTSAIILVRLPAVNKSCEDAVT